jgi:membrane protein CcdC involved in cytochrome C biogenesis
MEASSAAKRKYGGQMNMSQVLGAFWLLDFTMLLPDLSWRAF